MNNPHNVLSFSDPASKCRFLFISEIPSRLMITLGAVFFISLAVVEPSRAGPDFHVETYDQWLAELGSGGHIKPLTNWGQFSFELIYPGEEASFRVPALSVLSDVDGKPAMLMDFGTATAGETVIGGFVYHFGEDPDLTGKIFTFSVLKRIAGTLSDQFAEAVSAADVTFSLDLKDAQGDTCHWWYEIPPRTFPTEDKWANISFDPSQVVPYYLSPNFDLDSVVEVAWDYKGTALVDKEVKMYFDHINIPEPTSAALVTMGLLILCHCSLKRKRKRASPHY